MTRSVIQIRVSPEEKETIEKLAELSGEKVSEWVRRRALNLPKDVRAGDPGAKSESKHPPTAVWLSGKTGLPKATCQHRIDSNTWRELL